jgi:hypothetical protein
MARLEICWQDCLVGSHAHHFPVILETFHISPRLRVCESIKNVDIQDGSHKLIDVEPVIVSSLHELLLDTQLLLESQVSAMLFASLNGPSLDNLYAWPASLRLITSNLQGTFALLLESSKVALREITVFSIAACSLLPSEELVQHLGILRFYFLA